MTQSFEDSILSKRVRLARLPTPIVRLDNTENNYGFKNRLYIKRDDLTGVGTTGNKIRKLEYLVHDAIAQGANLLVTCGGLDSNHSRATAIAAAQKGLKSHLVLRADEAVELYQGNTMLDKLVDARIQLVSRAEYQKIEQVYAAIAEEYSTTEMRPYFIPEGGSNSVGILGYVNAAYEIKTQCDELDISIDRIATAVGTGGTLAGLLIGAKLLDWELNFTGFPVCDSNEYFYDELEKIISAFEEMFKLDLGLQIKTHITLKDDYIGRGYALSTPEELRFIHNFAKNEGLFVDPVYTGKALRGLFEELKTMQTIEPEERVLFLHTGGIFGLFSKTAQINKIFV